MIVKMMNMKKMTKVYDDNFLFFIFFYCEMINTELGTSRGAVHWIVTHAQTRYNLNMVDVTSISTFCLQLSDQKCP